MTSMPAVANDRSRSCVRAAYPLSRGYVGIDKPRRRETRPRHKPRGRKQSEEDKSYNPAFAQDRIAVEHGIVHY